MASPRYLANSSFGRIKMVPAITSSVGAADAEKIVATAPGTGVLDDSLMGAATTGSDVVVKTLATGLLDASIVPLSGQGDVAAHVAEAHPHAQYPQMSAAVTIDGDVLEYDGSAANWAPTGSPRKLYLDGGNF